MIVRVATLDYFTFIRLYFWCWKYYIYLWLNTIDQYRFPSSLIQDIRISCHFYIQDLLLTIFLGVFLTFLRIWLTKHYFVPWCIQLESPPRMLSKLPENFWKLGFYTISWSWSLYVVGYRHNNWLSDPLSTWDEWKMHERMPWDVYITYVMQFGFYLHSVYATIYLDPHRKDFTIMFVHHIVTLGLIAMSYAANHYRVGAMVLYCHDITDIFLELWKMNSNWRKRANSRYYKFHDRTAIICFVCFITSWIYFRLYLFPLKVLYAALYGSLAVMPPYMIRFWLIFAIKMTLLLCLNLYWFYLMLSGLYRFFVVGSIHKIEDDREVSENSDNDEELNKYNDNYKQKNSIKAK